MTLSYGWKINSLRVSYRVADGTQHYTPIYGNEAGQKTLVILADDERITTIEGFASALERLHSMYQDTYLYSEAMSVKISMLLVYITCHHCLEVIQVMEVLVEGMHMMIMLVPLSHL